MKSVRGLFFTAFLPNEGHMLPVMRFSVRLYVLVGYVLVGLAGERPVSVSGIGGHIARSFVHARVEVEPDGYLVPLDPGVKRLLRPARLGADARNELPADEGLLVLPFEFQPLGAFGVDVKHSLVVEGPQFTRVNAPVDGVLRYLQPVGEGFDGEPPQRAHGAPGDATRVHDALYGIVGDVPVSFQGPFASLGQALAIPLDAHGLEAGSLG
jgi:hypothetical protein